jgi:hypothetical protein
MSRLTVNLKLDGAKLEEVDDGRRVSPGSGMIEQEALLVDEGRAAKESVQGKSLQEQRQNCKLPTPFQSLSSLSRAAENQPV